MPFIGIGKLISELAAGTPEETDNFIFANSGNVIKKITMKALKKALGIDELNSALTPETYPGESMMNGFECTAIVCGNVVTFKVRGRTSIKLGTSSNYAHCAQFSKLSPLIASKSDHIKRVIINNKYFGQLRFDISTCSLRIGYTFDNSGNAVDIPQGTDFYVEETFAL